MRSLLTYWLKLIGCWILFLQMINLSIDPPEASAVFQTKTAQQAAASLNERETVYEYVSEEFLAFNIPDSEKQDVEKSNHAFELYYPGSPQFTLAAPGIPLQHLSFYSSHLSCWESMPHAPPPKA